MATRRKKTRLVKVSTTLPAEMVTALRRLARQNGVTISDVIRAAVIRQYFSWSPI